MSFIETSNAIFKKHEIEKFLNKQGIPLKSISKMLEKADCKDETFEHNFSFDDKREAFVKIKLTEEESYALIEMVWFKNNLYHREKGPALIIYNSFLNELKYLWYLNGERGGKKNIDFARSIPKRYFEINYINQPEKPIALKKIYKDRTRDITLKFFFINQDNLYAPKFLSVNKNNKIISVKFENHIKEGLSVNEINNFLKIAHSFNCNPLYLERYNSLSQEMHDLFLFNFYTNNLC